MTRPFMGERPWVEWIDWLIENRRKQDEGRERRRHTEDEVAAYRQHLMDKYGFAEKQNARTPQEDL